MTARQLVAANLQTADVEGGCHRLSNESKMKQLFNRFSLKKNLMALFLHGSRRNTQ